MFEEISFPEREYEAIQNYLNKLIREQSASGQRKKQLTIF